MIWLAIILVFAVLYAGLHTVAKAFDSLNDRVEALENRLGL